MCNVSTLRISSFRGGVFWSSFRAWGSAPCVFGPGCRRVTWNCVGELLASRCVVSVLTSIRAREDKPHFDRLKLYIIYVSRHHNALTTLLLSQLPFLTSPNHLLSFYVVVAPARFLAQLVLHRSLTDSASKQILMNLRLYKSLVLLRTYDPPSPRRDMTTKSKRQRQEVPQLFCTLAGVIL